MISQSQQVIMNKNAIVLELHASVAAASFEQDHKHGWLLEHEHIDT